MKDMKEADGASMMGKISSRFTADFMGLTPFFSLDRLGGGAAKMSPTDRSCHLYVGVIARRGRAPAPTGPLGTPPAYRRWARGTPKRPAPNQPLSPGPRRGFFAAYEAPRVAEQPVKLANLVLKARYSDAGTIRPVHKHVQKKLA